jgi:hypothetical protein
LRRETDTIPGMAVHDNIAWRRCGWMATLFQTVAKSVNGVGTPRVWTEKNILKKMQCRKPARPHQICIGTTPYLQLSGRRQVAPGRFEAVPSPIQPCAQLSPYVFLKFHTRKNQPRLVLDTAAFDSGLSRVWLKTSDDFGECGACKVPSPTQPAHRWRSRFFNFLDRKCKNSAASGWEISRVECRIAKWLKPDLEQDTKILRWEKISWFRHPMQQRPPYSATTGLFSFSKDAADSRFTAGSLVQLRLSHSAWYRVTYILDK